MLKIEALTNQLPLGRQGENKAIQIVFDPLKLFGLSSVDGYSFTLVNRRPTEAAGYPVINIEIEDNKVVWDVRDLDNAIAGSGEAQLNCFKGDTLYKSFTYTTIISPSIDGTGDVPEPYEDIIDQITGIYNDTVTVKEEVEGLKTIAEDAARSAAASSDSAHAYGLEAKEYAERAEGFATAARAASAESNYYSGVSSNAAERADAAAALALSGKTAAEGSATAAAGSATAAAGSATAAAGSATAAAGSATSAAGSATAAGEILRGVINLLPTDSVSGHLASFPDGASNVEILDLTCTIEPRQSGSGDPSPTNIRPINGWLGTTLTHAGVNLLDTSRVEAGTRDQTTGEPISGSGNQQRTTYYIKVNAGQKIVNTNSKNENCRAFFFLGSTYVSTALLANNTATTAPNGVDRMYISSSASGWTGSTAPTWAQIEIGDTSTEYKPYSANTYNVSWVDEVGTVYGGTLDTVSGLLTVDTQHFIMNGTTRPVTYTTTASGYRLFVGMAPSPSIIGAGTTAKPYLSDKFKMKYSSVPGQAYMSGGNGQQITMYLLDQSIDNLDDANNWLAENQPEFVVALATPVTYQLEPTETIRTYLGSNNFWNDTGDTSVTYKADIGLYIEKKLPPSSTRVLKSIDTDDIVKNEEILPDTVD